MASQAVRYCRRLLRERATHLRAMQSGGFSSYPV